MFLFSLFFCCLFASVLNVLSSSAFHMIICMTSMLLVAEFWTQHSNCPSVCIQVCILRLVTWPAWVASRTHLTVDNHRHAVKICLCICPITCSHDMCSRPSLNVPLRAVKIRADTSLYMSHYLQSRYDLMPVSICVPLLAVSIRADTGLYMSHCIQSLYVSHYVQSKYGLTPVSIHTDTSLYMCWYQSLYMCPIICSFYMCLHSLYMCPIMSSLYMC